MSDIKVRVVNTDLFYNNKYIGYLEIMDDGYFAAKLGRGLHQSHTLIEIANIIDEKNKVWDNFIKENLNK